MENEKTYESILSEITERCPSILWRDDSPEISEMFRNAIQLESVTALEILYDSLGWARCQTEMEELSDSFRAPAIRNRYHRSRNFISLLWKWRYWNAPIQNLKEFLPSELFENGSEKFRSLRLSRSKPSSR